MLVLWSGQFAYDSYTAAMMRVALTAIVRSSAISDAAYIILFVLNISSGSMALVLSPMVGLL